MSWFSIVKKELPFNELVDEVADELDDFLTTEMEVSGDYDDEKEGYRNAETDYLSIKYPDSEIKVEPSMTDDEDDDITTEYDLYFNDVRLGSYTGSYGHYISASDWEEYERKDLEELLDALKDRK